MKQIIRIAFITATVLLFIINICSAAFVVRKEGRVAASGWTYNRTFVLYDKETMSLWYPEKKGLRGISGEHLDQFLPIIDSEYTNWNRWEDDHPESRVLQ